MIIDMTLFFDYVLLVFLVRRFLATILISKRPNLLCLANLHGWGLSLILLLQVAPSFRKLVQRKIISLLLKRKFTYNAFLQVSQIAVCANAY